MAMDMIKGLRTTLGEFRKKPTTVSYPEEHRSLPPRFVGGTCSIAMKTDSSGASGATYVLAHVQPTQFISKQTKIQRNIVSLSVSGMHECSM